MKNRRMAYLIEQYNRNFSSSLNKSYKTSTTCEKQHGRFKKMLIFGILMNYCYWTWRTEENSPRNRRTSTFRFIYFRIIFYLFSFFFEFRTPFRSMLIKFRRPILVSLKKCHLKNFFSNFTDINNHVLTALRKRLFLWNLNNLRVGWTTYLISAQTHG